MDRDHPDRDSLPRQSPPWDWHLVAANEAGGMHPTGMHTCFNSSYMRHIGVNGDLVLHKLSEHKNIKSETY